MTNTTSIVDAAIKGIQEKKGKKIEVINLQGIHTAITKYMVVCQGNSPSHTSSIADEVWEQVRKEAGEKPISTDGMQNAEWIAMDYSDVVVHIFLPEQRDFYDLTHLWADAEIREIADLD